MVTFLVAITLLTMVPGADTVMVTRNAMRGGIKDGFYTSLGICNGLFVHAAISVGGLSILLLHSAETFHIIKLIGAAYLCWMGISSFRQMRKGKAAADNLTASHGQVSTFRSLREGFLSNVLNPKPVVFYMAFLPQFIDPAENTFLQASGAKARSRSSTASCHSSSRTRRSRLRWRKSSARSARRRSRTWDGSWANCASAMPGRWISARLAASPKPGWWDRSRYRLNGYTARISGRFAQPCAGVGCCPPACAVAQTRPGMGRAQPLQQGKDPVLLRE